MDYWTYVAVFFASIFGGVDWYMVLAALTAIIGFLASIFSVAWAVDRIDAGWSRWTLLITPVMMAASVLAILFFTWLSYQGVQNG